MALLKPIALWTSPPRWPYTASSRIEPLLSQFGDAPARPEDFPTPESKDRWWESYSPWFVEALGDLRGLRCTSLLLATLFLHVQVVGSRLDARGSPNWDKRGSMPGRMLCTVTAGTGSRSVLDSACHSSAIALRSRRTGSLGRLFYNWTNRYGDS